MNDAGMMTIRTSRGNFRSMSAGMADEIIGIRVESKREKTVRAEGLPATVLTDSKRGGATTVVKNEGLVVVFEIARNVL